MTFMVTNASSTTASQPTDRGQRSGFSLLEVLVACGILIFALAGIAAILPAAGSVLADSVAQDRSSMLAANVVAELASRGVLRADAIPAGPNALAVGCLGNSFTWLTGTDAAFKDAQTYLVAPLITGNGGTVFDRAWPYALIKSSPQDHRGFFIEDDLVSTTAGSGVSLAYEAGDPAAGTAIGPRRFNRRVSWFATITTASNSPIPRPGSVATLSIATLKKPGDVAAIQLLRVTSATNMFFLPPGNQTVLKTYLSPGSSFLALPPSSSPSGPRPTWFRVSSSWTAVSGTSFLMVQNNTVPLDDRFDTSGPPKVIQSIGFAGLLRLDEFPVTLK